ncbi:MAG: hypothetical protein GF346_12585 [Candidatus Eisenbacteria bacterium]|nr:hypothetical protein [Candidatus Latescibacterota bacterium]MBD3303273.1 hypothetical protein [Candidatus Eisenbacteria bacterium]
MRSTAAKEPGSAEADTSLVPLLLPPPLRRRPWGPADERLRAKGGSMRILLLTVLGCFATFGSATPGSCGPVLNEVMADPSLDWDGDGEYSYRDDEWVEIYNPGPGSLDLDGFLLGDGDESPLYPLTGLLEEGEHLVVYGSEAYAFQQENDWGAYGLRLGNSGDTVTLLQEVDDEMVLFDAYTYEDHEAEDDRSSGRLPDGEADWVLFDSLNPYGGDTEPLGTGLPPSPGGPNGEEVVPVRTTTWGKLRTLYR